MNKIIFFQTVKTTDGDSLNCSLSDGQGSLGGSGTRPANIVSLQSTACPGAMIALEAVSDSRSNNGWRHVELFHVFQVRGRVRGIEE